MLTVQIRGNKELQRKIEELGDNFDKELEIAVVAGALLFVNEAKNNAPYKTGTLRRSLHVGGHTSLTPDYKRGEGYSDLGGRKRSRNQATIRTGTNLVYARRQEYGFSGKDSRGRVYNQRAKAYMRRAFSSQKDKVSEEIQAALGILLKRV